MVARAADAGQEGDVVEFGDLAFDGEPMRQFAAVQIDDQQAAALVETLRFQPLGQINLTDQTALVLTKLHT